MQDIDPTSAQTQIVTLVNEPEKPRPRTWVDVFFGRRLASAEESGEKIGPLAGVPVLGLDALSSAAYGPEAALTLLLPLGLVGLPYIVPISAVIILLLTLVYLSYRQTISAYPHGGGSYTVAKDNLGQSWAILAGAALALDYVLNVAVGISAGVGALVSALPQLLPYTSLLCLVILAFLTFVNLRGTRESGLTFLLPTYLFVGSLGAVLVIGIAKAVLSGGHPVAVLAPPTVAAPTEAVGLWLLVRAFASGCTAMTGVEAVSNGVPVFKPPTIKNAERTLTIIVALLVAMLGGIAVLARTYGIAATPPGEAGYQSILSMLTKAVVGQGVFYYVTMGAVVAVLALSANTSFADFPRLCRILAVDRFLPDAFAVRGRRLIFSNGVIVLAVVSGLLLIAFGGVTDRLIPLFAVGAFLAFTLSQAGMVKHWRKLHPKRAPLSLWINAVGAVATGITLIVVVVSKFIEGAWIAVLVVPAMVILFLRIHRHYAHVAKEIALESPLVIESTKPPIVIVPVQSWNRLTSRGLRVALDFSADVRAVHILKEDTTISDLTLVWEELVAEPVRASGLAVPKLILCQSTYRQFFAPLVAYIEQVRDENPDRDIIVIVSDLVVSKWYHAFLHNNRGALLRTLLRLRGGSRVVVVGTHSYLGS